MFSKSWKVCLGNVLASSRSSRRRSLASLVGRKLWIMVQGVYLDMSSGEKRCKVRPLFVRGFDPSLGVDKLAAVTPNDESELCMPRPLEIVRFLLLCGGVWDDRVEHAVVTDPSLSINESRRISCSKSGKSDARMASFISVDSSSLAIPQSPSLAERSVVVS